LERVTKWVHRRPAIAALAAGLLVALLAGTVAATLEWRRAEANAENRRKDLYVADIGLAFQAWEAGEAGRARDLLDQQRPTNRQSDLRTFEWRYLYGITRTQEVFTFQSKSPEIWDSAVSPNGRIFAAGSGDGRIQVWDFETRQEQAAFPLGRQEGAVYTLEFSPDGQTLAARGGSVTNIDLWDTETWQTKGVLRGHTNGGLSLAFSPDSKLIASIAGKNPYATNEPSEILIWDVASTRRVKQLSGHRVNVGRVAFSPHGSTLATPMGDGTTLLWDVQSGQITKTLRGHRDMVIAAAFSPDGKLLATAGRDGTVRLWDPATSQMIGLAGVHSTPVFDIAFSPDGKLLASGGLDHMAKVWDLAERDELVRFKGHVGRIYSVNFSHDGRHLVTGSLDGTAKLWEIPSQTGSRVFDYHPADYASVGFSSDGRWLIRHTGGQATLWNAATHEKVGNFPARGFQFSPDGKLLISVHNFSFDVFDSYGAIPKLIRTNAVQARLSGHVHFSADGKLLALRTEAGPIIFWSTADWTKTRDTDFGAVSDYLFSPDGRLFATRASDQVSLWSTSGWARRGTFPVPRKDPLGLAFSPDGRWLAIGCRDAPVQLWDSSTGESYALRSEAGAVWCLAFTHDGKTLAVGSHDGLVKFWNVATRREVTTLRAHLTIVTGLAFSADDKTFATASFDGTMRLWTAPGLEATDSTKPKQ
jgi:WD40 repeat protein